MTLDGRQGRSSSSGDCVVRSDVKVWNIRDLSDWESDWLGITYGPPTHGFTEAAITSTNALRVEFYWFGGGAHIYQSRCLRYNRRTR